MKVCNYIGSSQAQKYLLAVEDAKDDNLLVTESTVYVNALWEIYRSRVLLVNSVVLM